MDIRVPASLLCLCTLVLPSGSLSHSVSPCFPHSLSFSNVPVLSGRGRYFVSPCVRVCVHAGTSVCCLFFSLWVCVSQDPNRKEMEHSNLGTFEEFIYKGTVLSSAVVEEP